MKTWFVPFSLVLVIGACNSDAPAVVRASALEVEPAPAVADPPLPPPAVPMVPPDPNAIDPGALDNAKVVELAKIAREVEADPARVDEVLEGHGMDRAAFETAITEIAKDGWKSDLYIATLGKR